MYVCSDTGWCSSEGAEMMNSTMEAGELFIRWTLHTQNKHYRVFKIWFIQKQSCERWYIVRKLYNSPYIVKSVIPLDINSAE